MTRCTRPRCTTVPLMAIQLPVTARAADARLLLPRSYPTASVLPGASSFWKPALAASSVQVGEAAPLVVGDATEAALAVSSGAESLLLEGAPSAAVLRRAGYRVARYLVVPGTGGPRLLVPLADRPMKEAIAHHLAQSGQNLGGGMGIDAR